MRSRVLAGALSMLRRVRDSLAVLVVSSVVRAASVLRAALEGTDSPAELAVPEHKMATVDSPIPNCKRCAPKLVTPRKLKRLPIEVVRAEEFNNRDLPVLLCEECDGGAYERAMRAHAQRTENG